MSLTSAKEIRPFVKGTLPSWIAAVLLAIIGYMSKSFLEEFKDYKTRTADNSTRIAVMESQYKEVKDALTDLRMAQKDVLAELKAINVSIQKR